MKTKDLLREYKSYLRIERGLSRNTVENYLRDLIHFFNALEIEDIRQVTKEDIDDYLSLLNDQYASSSIERKMVTLRQFYAFLLQERYIDTNILASFDLPKRRRSLPHVLTMEDIYQLLASIDQSTLMGKRDYCMILLLISTGMRVSELTHLKTSSLNLRAQKIKVIGKGQKERIIPVDSQTCEILQSYINDERRILDQQSSPLLFLTRKGEMISRENFYYRLNKHAQNAALSKHITPHMLRHTFATTLLEGDADLRSIQELLGHSDIATSTIYTHVARHKINEDYHKFHPGNRENSDE